MLREVSWLLGGCCSRRCVRAALLVGRPGCQMQGWHWLAAGLGQQEKDCPEQLMRDTLPQIDII